MPTPKPPLRCPCCGDALQELSKRWERRRFPWGKTIRYPVAIVAAYHCGARVEARYVAREGLSERLSAAYWQMEATQGCRNAVIEELDRRLPLRHRRRGD